MTDHDLAPQSFRSEEIIPAASATSDRFVCAFIIGYARDADEITSPAQCRQAAIDYVSEGAYWWVHDRVTGRGAFVEDRLAPDGINLAPPESSDPVALDELRSYYLDQLPRILARADGESARCAVDMVASFVTTVDLDPDACPAPPALVRLPGLPEADDPQLRHAMAIAAGIACERALEDDAIWAISDRASGDVTPRAGASA